MAKSHEAFFQRMVKVLNDGDYAEYEKLLSEDYVEEYPQSGEVIKGPKNSRAIRENYPGAPLVGVDGTSARLAGTEARWVMTQTFTSVRVGGSGATGTAALLTNYPDGSRWWVVVMYELRGDRLVRGTFFFAPEFEAPDWRKPYRENANARS